MTSKYGSNGIIKYMYHVSSYTVVIIPKVTRHSVYYTDIDYNNIGNIFTSVIPQLASVKQGQAANMWKHSNSISKHS